MEAASLNVVQKYRLNFFVTEGLYDTVAEVGSLCRRDMDAQASNHAGISKKSQLLL